VVAAPMGQWRAVQAAAVAKSDEVVARWDRWHRVDLAAARRAEAAELQGAAHPVRAAGLAAVLVVVAPAAAVMEVAAVAPHAAVAEAVAPLAAVAEVVAAAPHAVVAEAALHAAVAEVVAAAPHAVVAEAALHAAVAEGMAAAPDAAVAVAEATVGLAALAFSLSRDHLAAFSLSRDHLAALALPRSGHRAARRAPIQSLKWTRSSRPKAALLRST
jgi:hypothetical protein